MSKSKNKKQFIVFDLTVQESEVPFATLHTSMKTFAKMRECFETLGLNEGSPQEVVPSSKFAFANIYPRVFFGVVGFFNSK